MLDRRERARIREKRREGKTASELATEYGVHKATIYRILAEGLRVPRKRGRHTKLSQHQRRNLIRKARENPTKSASKLANLAGVSISATTCRRELARNAFRHEHFPLLQGI